MEPSPLGPGNNLTTTAPTLAANCFNGAESVRTRKLPIFALVFGIVVISFNGAESVRTRKHDLYIQRQHILPPLQWSRVR